MNELKNQHRRPGLPDASHAGPGGRGGAHEGGRAARRGAGVLRVLRGVRALRRELQRAGDFLTRRPTGGSAMLMFTTLTSQGSNSIENALV